MGGARYDKGFLTIPDIIEKLEKLFVEAEFLVQGVNQSLGPQYDEVSQILKDNPKVTFIEEKLDLDIYHAYIEECSMLILPYAQDVYEMRGSAVVSDALALQVPVIAPANLGKSKDIQDFNLGAIYENIDQIGDCIEALLLKQKKPKYEEYLESVMYDIDRFLHR
jgi:glycosyltransferase involved in cell wall biosynthesis